MVIYEIDKKRETDWDMLTIYKIYEKDGERYLKLIGGSLHDYINGDYSRRKFAKIKHPDNCEIKMSELFEWNEQIEKMAELDSMGTIEECSPQELLDYLNELVSPGCERLGQIYLQEDEPCGYYFY